MGVGRLCCNPKEHPDLRQGLLCADNAPMTTLPISVGIVGYGYASKTFHAPLIRSVPGLHLAAIASSDPSKVRADLPGLPVEPDATALLARPDIDLVVIPTPNATHFPLARAALLAGKHVVVDKPFTVTLQEAQTLDALAQSKGRLLSVFHNRRWDADFLTLQSLLASGELGPVVHFESHFDRYRPEVRQRWREQADAGGGLWYDLGAHLLDQTLQLLGRPDALALDQAQQRTGAQATDWFHAVLHYGQARAILHASALVPVPAARFTVHGARGSLIKYGLDAQEDALKAGRMPGDANWGHDPVPAEVTLWQGDASHTRRQPCLPGNYAAYYAAVRDAVRGLGPNPVSAQQAMDVMGLIELGLQSAREGRVLAVPAAL